MMDYSTSVRIDAPAEMVKTWLAKAVKGLFWPYGKHPERILRDKPRSEIGLQALGWHRDRYRIRYSIAYESKNDPEIWNVQIMDADALLVDATALTTERTRLDLQWGDLVHALVLDLLAAMANDYPETRAQIYPAETPTREQQTADRPEHKPDQHDAVGDASKPTGPPSEINQQKATLVDYAIKKHGYTQAIACQKVGISVKTHYTYKKEGWLLTESEYIERTKKDLKTAWEELRST